MADRKLAPTKTTRAELDDDSELEHDGHSASCTSTPEADKTNTSDKVTIANSENQKVGFLRFTLLLVLVGLAAAAAFAAFHFSSAKEKDDFETYATEQCTKVVSTFEESAKRRLEAIESLVLSISSNAAAQNRPWPFVSVPDFEKRMGLTLNLADVLSLTMLPIVTGEQLSRWEDWSSRQGWFQEGLAASDWADNKNPDWASDVKAAEVALGSLPNNTIFPHIFPLGRHDEYYGSPKNTNTQGPFMPWWQFAPVFPVSSLINYNALEHPSRQPQLETVMADLHPLISEAFDYSDDSNPLTAGKKVVLNLYLKKWHGHGKKYQDGPVSDLYYPIFDDNIPHGAPAKLAAVLTAYVYWHVYFENILAANTEPVVAVLESRCGAEDEKQLQQLFTYEIYGEDAVYVGRGDLHDTKYDYLEVSSDWSAFMASPNQLDKLHRAECLYRLLTYPSNEMEEAMLTDQPLIFMLIVLAIFAGTSIVIVVYDYYVERRQRLTRDKAIASTKVINTLFPEAVRDRLFEETKGSNSKTDTSGFSMGSRAKQDDCHINDAPVADLYPDCTVFFADIAGFTHWSSTRTPTQVFHLLETLYAAFDKNARRRGIFKVETIGDCYVAVSGCPKARIDHAVVMTRFASNCLEDANEVFQDKNLIEQLGEGTRDLKLRVGLHSGPVTAGVVRGERARFQLFGDTVNTASRMESTGTPGRIQVSESTAALLKKAHKDLWLAPREGEVSVKGKGQMNTYWVLVKQSGSTTSGSTTSFETSEDLVPPNALLSRENDNEIEA